MIEDLRRPRHARQRAGDRDVASSAARRGSTATSAATTGRRRGRVVHGRLRAQDGRRRRQDERQGHGRGDRAEYDIGHLFHTWFRALGIDPDETEYDNDGQPLPIAHEDMKPVKEVLA